MGNYNNLEYDFIQRTLNLISQYEHILHNYEFEFQYNYTLLLNCLLGLIVMPKDRVFTYMPNHKITNKLKSDMGLNETILNSKYQNMRDFIHELRNAVAHFNVEIISEDENDLIDRIVFTEEDGSLVADFKSIELQPFIRYYANWIQSNLIKNKLKKIPPPAKNPADRGF